MNLLKKIIINNEFIKNNKKLSLVIIFGFLIIFILFISELNMEGDENSEVVESEMSVYEYSDYLEKKVTEIIESIDGAGKAKVMITISETTEYVYATNDKDTIKDNEKSIDSSSENDYVIVEQNSEDTGLLIKKIEPKIRGVAIVCQGGDSVLVQNQIFSTVSAVLNVNSSKISISKSGFMEE